MGETQTENIARTQSFQSTDSNALKLRLESAQILEKLEIFLRGKYPVTHEEKGKIVTEYVSIGSPQANELGVQMIMNKLQSIINPQVVQGNFDQAQYDQYIFEINVELIVMLTVNCYNWEIADENIQPICNFCMNFIIPYVSRLIDNKERESYNQTLVHRESNTLAQKGGGLGMIK